MEYQENDLIEILEDKQILHDIYLKRGTLVYINEIDENQLNVSEINSDYNYWITAYNTKLVERGENGSK